MKKLLSILLVIAISFCFSASALATESKKEAVEYPKAISDEELAEILKTAESVEAPQVSGSFSGQEVSREHNGMVVYNPQTKEVKFEAVDFVASRSTGQSVPQYVPSGVETAANQTARSLDDFTEITDTTVGPWLNTVRLVISTSEGVGVGTGFMIGPNTIATAGHNVYQQTWGGFAYNILVVPAYNGGQQPYGSYLTTSYACGGNWYNYQDNTDDWAIIRINYNIGLSTGYLGLKWQSASYNGTTAKAVGYPEEDNIHMYYSSGTVNYSAARLLRGSWSLQKGMSGGPVHTYYADTGYTAIGFNSCIRTINGVAHSEAMRIDEWIYNLFVSYRDQAYTG